jgi:hypothetical protein
MKIAVLGLAVGCVIAAGLCSTWEAKAAATSADLDRFCSYWAGDYDNLDQARSQSGLSKQQQNVPMRLYIRRVDLPAFGANVYYAEWQAPADANKILRQRLYALDIDDVTGKLRLGLNIFPAENRTLMARTAGAYEHPERLSGVTPADMAGLKGCDVLFERSGAGFAGAMTKGACAFPAPDTGQPIYSWSQMAIDAKSFRYLDNWFNPDGSFYRKRNGGWYQFEKLRATGSHTG